ncbi:MAG: ATP-grasp domain-containing protein [Parachlamydiales bacterium]|jgi:ribosomal protein S6--L-glutamate ligase
MSHGKIGIWMYKNDGGIIPRTKLIKMLRDKGYEVIDDFDLRKCYCINNFVMTEDGRDLTSLDLLFHMNADERSDQQIDMLHALELSGVKVINPFYPFENARDKFISNMKLRKAGIKVPDSLLIGNNFSDSFMKKLFDDWGSILVKPRKWFGGQGIVKFDNYEHFMDLYGLIEKHFSQLFLQRFIPFTKQDYRVEIINGEVVDYYSRAKEHQFKTNVHLGGHVVPSAYDEEKIILAKKAAKALDIPITIVDIIQSSENGESYVLEVNDSLGVFIEAHSNYAKLKIYEELSHDDKKLNMLFDYIVLQMKTLNKVKKEIL